MKNRIVLNHRFAMAVYLVANPSHIVEGTRSTMGEYKFFRYDETTGKFLVARTKIKDCSYSDLIWKESTMMKNEFDKGLFNRFGEVESEDLPY